MSRFVTSSLDDFSFVDDEGKRIPGLFGEDRESPEGSAATRQYSLSLTDPAPGGPDEIHAAFADEIRKLARRASAALHAALGRSPDPHGVARAWAAEWTPKLASLLADARLAGELHGMRDLAGQFQGDVGPADWEPDAGLPMVRHAAAHLASMKLLGLPDYLRGRQDAEMAASEAAHDQTERVREALHKAVSEGGTLKDFRREAAGALDPAHAEVVFRDNVMAAYSAGQEKLLADPDVGGLFPYRQYVATHDTRVRSEHLALETAGIGGTAVYRADDPVWQAICPPKSHNCRCTWIALTVAQAAKLGVPEAKRWLESGIAPTAIKAWVAMPKLHVDADFAGGRELSTLTPHDDPDPDEVVGLVELATSPWQRYQGPHGGHGWKNASTGEVRYQPEMPAEHEGGGNENPATKNAANAAKPANEGKRGLLNRLFGLVSSKPTASGPKYAEVAHLGVAERAEVSAARKQFTQKLEQTKAKDWQRLASMHGGTPEEVQADAARRVNKLVGGLGFHVRVSSDDILGMILEGGFKNQFQTGGSRAALFDPRGRIRAESGGMGVPEDAPPDQRPIYGYLSDGKVPPEEEAAHGYGGIVVKLKDSVRERSTVSMGDSLQGATNGEFLASPAQKMSHLSVDPASLAAAGMDSLDDYQNFNRKFRTYIEAQTHGGVSADEIESVKFRREPGEAIKRRLAEMKVPWSVYE